MHSLKQAWLRISAIVTLITFTATQFSYAQNLSFQNPKSEIALPSVAGLMQAVHVPSQLASVENFSAGKSKMIFHIQNAHGHYEGEKKTENLLAYLEKEYGVTTILAEGAWNQLNPELIRFTPDKKENTEILEKLTQAAIVKGFETHLLNSPQSAGYGIEEEKLYYEGLKAFADVQVGRSKHANELAVLSTELEARQTKIFPTELRTLVKRIERHALNQIPFDKYLHELKEMTQKHFQADLSDAKYQQLYPQLVRIFKIEELEKTINAQAFAQEKSAFLKAVKPYLSQKTIDYRPSTMDKKRGDSIGERGLSSLAGTDPYGSLENLLNLKDLSAKLPNPGTAEFFLQMIQQLPPNFKYQRFQNVTHFFGLLILRSEIDAETLIAEVEKLETELMNQLAETEEAKNLVEELKSWWLTKKLINLEVTPSEFEHLKTMDHRLSTIDKNRGDSFASRTNPSSGGSGVTEGLPRGGVAGSSSSVIPAKAGIQSVIQTALSFYQIARERDTVMLRRIEERLKETKADKVAVITGGFHAGPFSEYFKKRGYSYAEIMPKLTDLDETGRDNYVNVMMTLAKAQLSPAQRSNLKGQSHSSKTQNRSEPIQQSVIPAEAGIQSTQSSQQNARSLIDGADAVDAVLPLLREEGVYLEVRPGHAPVAGNFVRQELGKNVFDVSAAPAGASNDREAVVEPRATPVGPGGEFVTRTYGSFVTKLLIAMGALLPMAASAQEASRSAQIAAKWGWEQFLLSGVSALSLWFVFFRFIPWVAKGIHSQFRKARQVYLGQQKAKRQNAVVQAWLSLVRAKDLDSALRQVNQSQSTSSLLVRHLAEQGQNTLEIILSQDNKAWVPFLTKVEQAMPDNLFISAHEEETGEYYPQSEYDAPMVPITRFVPATVRSNESKIYLRERVEQLRNRSEARQVKVAMNVDGDLITRITLNVDGEGYEFSRDWSGTRGWGLEGRMLEKFVAQLNELGVEARLDQSGDPWTVVVQTEKGFEKVYPTTIQTADNEGVIQRAFAFADANVYEKLAPFLRSEAPINLRRRNFLRGGLAGTGIMGAFSHWAAIAQQASPAEQVQKHLDFIEAAANEWKDAVKSPLGDDFYLSFPPKAVETSVSALGEILPTADKQLRSKIITAFSKLMNSTNYSFDGPRILTLRQFRKIPGDEALKALDGFMNGGFMDTRRKKSKAHAYRWSYEVDTEKRIINEALKRVIRSEARTQEIALMANRIMDAHERVQRGKSAYPAQAFLQTELVTVVTTLVTIAIAFIIVHLVAGAVGLASIWITMGGFFGGVFGALILGSAILYAIYSMYDASSQPDYKHDIWAINKRPVKFKGKKVLRQRIPYSEIFEVMAKSDRWRNAMISYSRGGAGARDANVSSALTKYVDLYREAEFQEKKFTYEGKRILLGSSDFLLREYHKLISKAEFKSLPEGGKWIEGSGETELEKRRAFIQQAEALVYEMLNYPVSLQEMQSTLVYAASQAVITEEKIDTYEWTDQVSEGVYRPLTDEEIAEKKEEARQNAGDYYAPYDNAVWGYSSTVYSHSVSYEVVRRQPIFRLNTENPLFYLRVRALETLKTRSEARGDKDAARKSTGGYSLVEPLAVIASGLIVSTALVFFEVVLSPITAGIIAVAASAAMFFPVKYLLSGKKAESDRASLRRQPQLAVRIVILIASFVLSVVTNQVVSFDKFVKAQAALDAYDKEPHTDLRTRLRALIKISNGMGVDGQEKRQLLDLALDNDFLVMAGVTYRSARAAEIAEKLGLKSINLMFLSGLGAGSVSFYDSQHRRDFLRTELDFTNEDLKFLNRFAAQESFSFEDAGKAKAARAIVDAAFYQALEAYAFSKPDDDKATDEILADFAAALERASQVESVPSEEKSVETRDPFEGGYSRVGLLAVIGFGFLALPVLMAVASKFVVATIIAIAAGAVLYWAIKRINPTQAKTDDDQGATRVGQGITKPRIAIEKRSEVRLKEEVAPGPATSKRSEVRRGTSFERALAMVAAWTGGVVSDAIAKGRQVMQFAHSLSADSVAKHAQVKAIREILFDSARINVSQLNQAVDARFTARAEDFQGDALRQLVFVTAASILDTGVAKIAVKGMSVSAAQDQFNAMVFEEEGLESIMSRVSFFPADQSAKMFKQRSALGFTVASASIIKALSINKRNARIRQDIEETTAVQAVGVALLYALSDKTPGLQVVELSRLSQQFGQYIAELFTRILADQSISSAA